MDGKDRFPYARLVLGVGCILAGAVVGQIVDQRLMLVAKFPAATLLSGAIARLAAPRAPKTGQPPPLSGAEREMLAVVGNGGGLGLSEATERTSLSEVEAANVISALMEKGYLSVREAEGTTIYERAAG